MPTNSFDTFIDTPMGAASNAIAITPHDNDELTAITKALYVGGAGDLNVRMLGSIGDIVFRNVAAGTILDIRVRAVRASGTTATHIVGLI
jgi:hypothetical protein